MTDAPPLELVGLSKSFGSVKALSNVDLTVLRGEVLGLCGANGSGKSSLVKVLAGYHTPDRGSVIKVDGKVLGPQSKQRHLREAGIAIVHQDFGLIVDKSVTENIVVGNFEPGRWSRKVNWQREKRVAQELLERLDSNIDPRAMIGALSPADRSIVAIARALHTQRPGAGVIVLDESTRALPKDALEHFYRTLRSVVATGTSALMISHNLEEVMQVTDRVAVLRDGQLSGPTGSTANTTEAEIAQRMLGKSVTQDIHTQTYEGAGKPIAVRGLTGHLVKDASFAIHPGEVLGITGVAGSGWDEIPYLLTGARHAAAGAIDVNGQLLDLTKAGSARCINAGIALLPEHRIDHGLALSLSVAENITLPRVVQRGRRWRIGRAWQSNETQSVLDGLDVRPRRPDMPVGQLSGGNQQKVMLGKWLEGNPAVLVLHEPTQAVDVGAREDILRTIAQTASRGVAVLIASIQAADLAAVCNRTLIFHDGHLTDELTAPTADEILDAVYAGHLTLQEG